MSLKRPIPNTLLLMILPLIAASLLAAQSKPVAPVWWPLSQFVGESSDEVWPKLKDFSPMASKGAITFASGDIGVLYFLDPNGKIEVMNAVHLLDHRFVRVGAQGPTAKPENPTWLNPMKFMANSEDTVGDESIHAEMLAGQWAAIASGVSPDKADVHFYLPTYLVNLNGKSVAGQVEIKDSPVGQMIYIVCKMKDGRSVGAVAVSSTESLYQASTRFLPSSLTTVVAAKQNKINWKNWAIASLVVAPDAVFKETYPRRRDDGVFRQDLGDFGVFSFREDANSVPIADPSMAYTSTEFRPSEWGK